MVLSGELRRDFLKFYRSENYWRYKYWKGNGREWGTNVSLNKQRKWTWNEWKHVIVREWRNGNYFWIFLYSRVICQRNITCLKTQRYGSFANAGIKGVDRECNYCMYCYTTYSAFTVRSNIGISCTCIFPVACKKKNKKKQINAL